MGCVYSNNSRGSLAGSLPPANDSNDNPTSAVNANSNGNANAVGGRLFQVCNVDDRGNEINFGKIEITDNELVLHQKGRNSIYWPLRSLRRYGFDAQLFSFECGRRCPTGPGIYAFRCGQAEQLFNALQEAIQQCTTTSQYPIFAGQPIQLGSVAGDASSIHSGPFVAVGGNVVVATTQQQQQNGPSSAATAAAAAAGNLNCTPPQEASGLRYPMRPVSVVVPGQAASGQLGSGPPSNGPGSGPALYSNEVHHYINSPFYMNTPVVVGSGQQQQQLQSSTANGTTSSGQTIANGTCHNPTTPSASGLVQQPALVMPVTGLGQTSAAFGPPTATGRSDVNTNYAKLDDIVRFYVNIKTPMSPDQVNSVPGPGSSSSGSIAVPFPGPSSLNAIVGGQLITTGHHQSPPHSPTAVEPVNYIMLDLDPSPSSSIGGPTIVTTAPATPISKVPSMDYPAVGQSPPATPIGAPQQYAQIDFDRTQALVNSAINHRKNL